MGKKVIIVDDFKSVRNIVRKVLEKKGLEVHEAENGEDALKYFDGTHIDLLITDYDMPNLNGIELINRIRDIEEYENLPIIMLTTNDKERRENEMIDLIIDDWIVKPFDVFDFRHLIDAQLNK